MTRTIRREVRFPQPREKVWEALATSEALADWMYPNDFEPRVGHRFTFRVPPKPDVGFDGIAVQCEVLECEPPHRLAFSWTAGGPVVDTRVSFRLEPDQRRHAPLLRTLRLRSFSSRGPSRPCRAQIGWGEMLERLSCSDPQKRGTIVMNSSRERTILRWIHVIFALPIVGYIYGPAAEVEQYAPLFPVQSSSRS